MDRVQQNYSKLIFGLAAIIIKSHSVQINTDPMKTLIWNKTLPWELFEARTATERFLDALASHAFKLSVSKSVSHTFSDLQSIQFLQSLGL